MPCQHSWPTILAIPQASPGLRVTPTAMAQSHQYLQEAFPNYVNYFYEP